MGYGILTCWLLALLVSPAPSGWQSGLAVRYSEGVMEAVARTRGIDPQPCMIAYTHATDADMGVLWLEVEGVASGVRRRCLTVDLPRERDKAGLIRRDILVELDHESGQALCGAAWSGKATECRVRVRVAPDSSDKRGHDGHELYAVSVAELDDCRLLFQHRLHHC